MSRCVEASGPGAGMGERCIHHAGHRLIDHEAWTRDGLTRVSWRIDPSAEAARAVEEPGAMVGANAGARADLAALLGPDGWPIADLVLLAELVRLGRPGDVVAAHPSRVITERGDAPGESALRPETSPETRARADVLHAYRSVAMFRRLPRPEPSRTP